MSLEKLLVRYNCVFYACLQTLLLIYSYSLACSFLN